MLRNRQYVSIQSCRVRNIKLGSLYALVKENYPLYGIKSVLPAIRYQECITRYTVSRVYYLLYGIYSTPSHVTQEFSYTEPEGRPEDTDTITLTEVTDSPEVKRSGEQDRQPATSTR